MNKILIGSDEGSYTPNAGTKTITLSDLSFTPSIEQLAYLYNKTQDVLYYAPAASLAKASISGYVITVDGSFANLGASDELHIQMWKNPPHSGVAFCTHSNASDDFTATITAATTNITVTGLDFTLEAKHVVAGFIKKRDSSNNIIDLPLTDVSVSGGVITLGDASNFASGDTVIVGLLAATKAFDGALGAYRSYVLNAGYAHYTSVEYLINESNLGLDGTHDGGDAATDFEDSGETYTAEDVAEGYEIYNITDGSDATVDADTLFGLAGDGGAVAGDGNITHDTLANGTDNDWDDGDVASIPECKRFVIPAEGYNLMAIDVLLDSQDANNSCYCKIYATLDENADDTDDTYWKDISNEVFGAAQLSADGIGGAARAVTQGIYFIDSPTAVLKYMIKIVAENNDGTQDNEFDIRIKKSSNG